MLYLLTGPIPAFVREWADIVKNAISGASSIGLIKSIIHFISPLPEDVFNSLPPNRDQKAVTFLGGWGGCG